MSDADKTVFISYRRNVSSYIARAIFQDLRSHGYDVFLDVESIDSGAFDSILLHQIEARGHFLLILTPGTLERCIEPDDWLRHEIEYAMETQRNIVPVLVNDFTFAGTEKYLTGKLSSLPRYNGLPVYHEYFDAAMDSLRSRFLKQPVHAVLIPAPLQDSVIVEQKIAEAASQPSPTAAELTAEQLAIRAYEKDEAGDLEGALADYDQAIRLNPQYATAYNNRGTLLSKQGDVTGAIRDYTRAIDLNPQYTIAYFNRANLYDDAGNFEAAIGDYAEAIRLNPRDAFAYNNRAIARSHHGDAQGAVDDYTEAIRLNPEFAYAYNNRGVIRLNNRDLEGAISDFSQAIRLDLEYSYAYNNRGKAYFAARQYPEALADFQQLNHLMPNSILVFAQLAISYHALGRTDEAKRVWNALIAKNEQYHDAEWVGEQMNWQTPLVEAARKLIAAL